MVTVLSTPSSLPAGFFMAPPAVVVVGAAPVAVTLTNVVVWEVIVVRVMSSSSSIGLKVAAFVGLVVEELSVLVGAGVFDPLAVVEDFLV